MKLFKKKYKIVSLCNGEWFGLDEKENFLSTDWTRYRTYRFKQQAECAKIRLEKDYDKIFIYACSVKPKDLDDRIRIVDELQKLGYVNSTFFDSHQKYILQREEWNFEFLWNKYKILITKEKFKELYGEEI